MKTAVITVMMAVLVVLYQTDAFRHGHRHGHGHGHGHVNPRCHVETHASIPPCWTGQVSCPTGSTIQITGIHCKDRCTNSWPVACPTDVQNTINTNCNRYSECSVDGVTGQPCSNLTTVINVYWSCNKILTTTTSVPVTP